MTDTAANRDAQAMGTPPAGDLSAASLEDGKLAEEIMAAIDAEFSGSPPPGIEVVVTDRRASVAGWVEDAPTAERIEKAASTPAGLLGVHNALQWRIPEEEPIGTSVSQAALDQGEPLDSPTGQINHRV
jgi:osmotically-inducible protein OsmY